MAKIPRAQIEQMFDGMKREAGWNTAGELLWGYFFTAASRKRLEAIQQKLEGEGYRLIELHQAKPRLFVLHVEVTEIHSIDSLIRRNSQLETLASEFGVEYDGMDAGPVLAEAPPERRKPWWQFW